MIIYLILATFFGGAAAYLQRRQYKPTFTESLITFVVNGALMPLIIGLKLAGALKKNKVVVIPKL